MRLDKMEHLMGMIDKREETINQQLFEKKRNIDQELKNSEKELMSLKPDIVDIVKLAKYAQEKALIIPTIVVETDTHTAKYEICVNKIDFFGDSNFLPNGIQIEVHTDTSVRDSALFIPIGNDKPYEYIDARKHDNEDKLTDIKCLIEDIKNKEIENKLIQIIEEACKDFIDKDTDYDKTDD